MKKAIFTLSFTLITIFLFAQVNLTKGLVAHYKFDGDAQDQSGNNNHGTASAVSSSVDRYNESNSSYLFNGTSSYIDVAHSPELQPVNGLSVSVWVKFEDNGANVQDLVRKGTRDQTTGCYELRYIHSLESITFGMRYSSTEREALYVPYPVNFNEWYHFVATYDNQTIKLYANGVQIGSLFANKQIAINSEKIRMGMTYYPQFPYQFKGQMDDVRIYDRGVSAEEVAALKVAEDEQHFTSKLIGRLYTDNDNDCKFGVGDEPQKNQIVVAKPGDFYGITDADGNYEITVPEGSYEVTPLVSRHLVKYISFVCPSTGKVAANDVKGGVDVTGLDLAVEVVDCALMRVDVSSDRRRRCFDNNTYVRYCNDGFKDATNVKIYVEFPQELEIKSASQSFTPLGNGLLEFNVGDVKAGECKTIHIVDHVTCGDESIRGKVVCTKAWITPSNNCFGPQASWDKSDVGINANCTPEKDVNFVLHNVGAGDMEDSLEFRLFADDALTFTHNYKLGQGDSLEIELDPNGHTIRLEADQHKDHPHYKWASAFMEGCNLTHEISMNEAPMIFSDGGRGVEISKQCIQIRDAYDPNDKRVTPYGITENKIVPPNTLLNYTIRFQNTGNDTAYKVVVVDTLPKDVDMSTLLIQGSSHNFTYEVTGKEIPVIIFTFDDIYLPDSFVNEPASNGFVKYSIMPVEGIKLGTQLKGFADIYFDFNSPVRTNTALTTIDVFVKEDYTLLDSIRVGDSKVSVFKLPYDDIIVKAYPNPTNDQLTIQFDNFKNKQVLYTMIDLNGKVVYQNTLGIAAQRQEVTIDVNNLAKGIYYLRVQVDGYVKTLKIVVSE